MTDHDEKGPGRRTDEDEERKDAEPPEEPAGDSATNPEKEGTPDAKE